MKVVDVMQTEVDYVSPNTSLLDVSRLIFGHKINGVPVCKGKKIIGFITERDILAKFYPTPQEYIEDYVHARDFEGMEEKIKEILSLPAESVMNKNVTTITANTPLLKAQSFMQVRKVGRLPVIDGEGNLIGILSKGDIFRAVVGTKIPVTDLERYHDFLSKYYDVFVEWDKRLYFELPNLIKLFQKEKVKKIVDVGCGTGQHIIELAKKGFTVVGLDNSPWMIKIANQKREKLPQAVRNRVRFVLTEYRNLSNEMKEEFDAGIFMGNALPYIIPSTEHILKGTISVLKKKSPLLVFQILNFDKVFNAKSRLLSFKIAKSNLTGIQEHLFLEFYDRGKKDVLYHNLVVLDSYRKGENWAFKDSLTIKIRYIGKKEIAAILNKFDFRNVEYFGTQGEYQGAYGAFPGGEFKSSDSDWLNVIAKP